MDEAIKSNTVPSKPPRRDTEQPVKLENIACEHYRQGKVYHKKDDQAWIICLDCKERIKCVELSKWEVSPHIKDLLENNRRATAYHYIRERDPDIDIIGILNRMEKKIKEEEIARPKGRHVDSTQGILKPEHASLSEEIPCPNCGLDMEIKDGIFVCELCQACKL